VIPVGAVILPRRLVVLDGLPEADDGLEQLAKLLVMWTSLTATLVEKHVDDGTGRCVACDLRGIARQLWPCSIYNLAVRARAYEVPDLRMCRRDG
jgi:hypothetical protein